jgi:hypothetical protein
MKEWFDGKTVAIVGNAQYLFQRTYGEEIDSHDVVIRINRGIETCFDDKAKISHGKKLDIWTFNLYRTLENFDTTARARIGTPYKRLQMNYSIDLSKIDSTITKEAQDEIVNMFAPKKVTTGFRILHYMSKFKPTRVDVYGFDWKATPTFYIKHYSMADNHHSYSREKQYCMERYFKNGKYHLKN